MKYLVTILLCLTLSGCVLFKDALGGTANVAAGFEITHECFFNYPTHAAVVGFKFLDKCGQVMLPIDLAASMSKNELTEYVYAQFLGGLFTPCKEVPDVGPAVTGKPGTLGGDPVCHDGG